MELNMVYVVSERPAVGLSGPMADPEVLSSEDTAKSRLALYLQAVGTSPETETELKQQSFI